MFDGVTNMSAIGSISIRFENCNWPLTTAANMENGFGGFLIWGFFETSKCRRSGLWIALLLERRFMKIAGYTCEDICGFLFIDE
ncbi:hypothetical protein CEXT_681981 [Caerostris extrusa]|uniref:Uncharacterized protein n=1 Tax=Caerostris extrusa TaxID=172846 RepID=A0AAV4SE96_CAEEX|nr:hypothetical protein CEXT_681981 [Caerostris extrusa]